MLLHDACSLIELLLSAVKKEERRLRAKLQLRQGEDESEEDEDEADEEDGEEGAGWGARKRAYYDADEVRYQPRTASMFPEAAVFLLGDG